MQRPIWEAVITLEEKLRMYSSDISKSNKRQISKSNISKTAAIFEK